MSNVYSWSPRFLETFPSLDAGIKAIPKMMQENLPFAIGIIGTTNLALFGTMQFVLNRIDKGTQTSSGITKTFKHIVLNGVLGMATYGANYRLSIATGYALSSPVLLAMSIAAVALRLLLNLSSSDGKETDDATKGKVPLKVVTNKRIQIDPTQIDHLALKSFRQVCATKRIVARWRKKVAETKALNEAEKQSSSTSSPSTSSPPPPPPMLPKVVVQNVQLKDEPIAPQMNDLKELSDEKCVETINQYLTSLKKSLTPLEKAVEEEIKAQALLIEYKESLTAHKQERSDVQERLLQLDNQADVVYIEVAIKKGEPLRVPLYSETKFKEINDILLSQKKEDDAWADESMSSSGKSAGLNEVHQRKSHVNYLTQRLVQIDKQIRAHESLIFDQEFNLVSIHDTKVPQEAQTATPILFTEFKKIIDEKSKNIRKWTSTLQQYTRKMKPKEDKTERPSSAPDPFRKRDAELTLSEIFAQKHPHLPLKEWAELQENQSFIIALRNDDVIANLQEKVVVNGG